MRLARILLFLPGAAALVWGCVLLVEFVTPVRPGDFATAMWLLGGPVVHDALFAPLVGLAGLLISRLAAPSWRTPLIGGAVVSGVLGIVAVPLVWREYGAPPVPGLHDENVVPGLLAALALVWSVVVLVGLRTMWRTTRHTERG